jgi:hypothetical protein
MKASKTAVIASVATVIGLASLSGAALAGAADTKTQDPMNSIVSAIAKKFNLNQADVQQVFDEQRTAIETKRAAEEKSRLDQAVTDGKITAEQRDKIIAKRAELKAGMENFKSSLEGKTDEERKATMEKQRTDLEQWAKDNGISEEYLNFFMKGPGGHGPGKRMMIKSFDGSTQSN